MKAIPRVCVIVSTAIWLLASTFALAEAPSLAHGLGVRDESKPQTPAEIYADVAYLPQAIRETSFPEALQQRAIELVDKAQRDLRPLASSKNADSPAKQAKAAQARQTLDQSLIKELSAKQVDELNRRTLILALQSLMLSGGWHAFLDETAGLAKLNLTADQQRKLEAVIDQAEQQTRDAGANDDALFSRQFADFMAARLRLREILTPGQRDAWDNWCYTTLIAAAKTKPADVPLGN